MTFITYFYATHDKIDVADTPNMEISHRPVIHDSVSQRHVTDDGSVNDPVRPGS